MVQQLGKVMNEDLRIEIVKMVKRSGEGHIPSSFSIVDILDHLYGKVLNVRPDEPDWEGRDYFILSKGHGCGAFYAVLHKYGFLTDQDIEDYSTTKGILGGHPDATIVPGAEASTGSLGHGFPTAVGRHELMSRLLELGMQTNRTDELFDAPPVAIILLTSEGRIPIP